MKAFKGEEAFTSAILSVTEKKQPKVVFSQGHGEASLDSTERGRGYSDVKQLLERDNLIVATWDSLGQGQSPRRRGRGRRRGPADGVPGAGIRGPREVPRRRRAGADPARSGAAGAGRARRPIWASGASPKSTDSRSATTS